MERCKSHHGTQTRAEDFPDEEDCLAVVHVTAGAVCDPVRPLPKPRFHLHRAQSMKQPRQRLDELEVAHCAARPTTSRGGFCVVCCKPVEFIRQNLFRKHKRFRL